jgi:hypothetical protein
MVLAEYPAFGPTAIPTRDPGPARKTKRQACGIPALRAGIPHAWPFGPSRCIPRPSCPVKSSAICADSPTPRVRRCDRTATMRARPAGRAHQVTQPRAHVIFSVSRGLPATALALQVDKPRTRAYRYVWKPLHIALDPAALQAERAFFIAHSSGPTALPPARPCGPGFFHCVLGQRAEPKAAWRKRELSQLPLAATQRVGRVKNGRNVSQCFIYLGELTDCYYFWIIDYTTARVSLPQRDPHSIPNTQSV